MQQAAQLVHTLDLACAALGVELIVQTFDVSFADLIDPRNPKCPSLQDRKAGGVMSVHSTMNVLGGGGTSTSGAMQRALRTLSELKAPRRILVTITDGQPGGSSGERANPLDTLAHMHRVADRMGIDHMTLGIGFPEGDDEINRAFPTLIPVDANNLVNKTFTAIANILRDRKNAATAARRR